MILFYISQAQSFNKENTAMEIPKDNKYFNIVRGSLPKTTSVVGKSSKGGFWDSPFGDGDRMWTIKGPSKTNGRLDDFLKISLKNLVFFFNNFN